PGLSGNRRQHHPLARLPTGYRHDCPRSREGAGEERGGERSVGDGTKARCGLLFWNRCTTVPQITLSSVPCSPPRPGRSEESYDPGANLVPDAGKNTAT